MSNCKAAILSYFVYETWLKAGNEEDDDGINPGDEVSLVDLYVRRKVLLR